MWLGDRGCQSFTKLKSDFTLPITEVMSTDHQTSYGWCNLCSILGQIRSRLEKQRADQMNTMNFKELVKPSNDFYYIVEQRAKSKAPVSGAKLVKKVVQSLLQ